MHSDFVVDDLLIAWIILLFVPFPFRFIPVVLHSWHFDIYILKTSSHKNMAGSASSPRYTAILVVVQF